MSDLFGNHIVGFPTRRLICYFDFFPRSSHGGKGKTWMKYINKITASKYFQSAAENKYIKKAMTEVSNTRLILTVELQKLNGTLAINIPPPPTDRLW